MSACEIIEMVSSKEIKKGSLLMMKGRPCKVTRVDSSKPGKHGSCKMRVTGSDIFTGKKYVELYHSHKAAPRPTIKKQTCTVSFVDTKEEYVNVITADYEQLEFLDFPVDRRMRTKLVDGANADKEMEVCLWIAPVIVGGNVDTEQGIMSVSFINTK